MKSYLIIIAAVISLQGNFCYTQNSVNVNTLRLSDYKFKSIFGYSENSGNDVICLLGTGFFRTARSDNSDSLISVWMSNHGSAVMIPVSSIVTKKALGAVSSITYCIILDGTDTLNNFLIKNGCFPGGTMLRPQTLEEMTAEEKKVFNTGQDHTEIKVFIDRNSYETYIDQIRDAEKYAEDNKLGIYSDDYNKVRDR